MARLFRYFQGDPVVTSSPTEVRMWVEDLDYNFLSYGEIFESAEINGERLLNITRKQLNELGIVRTDHQDILLKAVARIHQKGKVEEKAMSREDQNIKKMPTRFGKEREQLDHAIDRVLATISERRLARSLHGTNEQPTHSVLTATLELVNTVNMILNILERPPFDCMSEFSSLKNHLIKHITLLKHFSEQADLSHENESDIIDVCKSVAKMCHYIISLPPDLPKPEIQVPGSVLCEERPSRVQVLLDNYRSASRGEGGSLAVPMRKITRSSEVPVWRSAERPSWGPEGGRLVRFERGYAVNPARDLSMMPAQGHAMIPARGRSMSPARGYSERCGRERAQSLTRAYTKRQARSRTMSPFRMHAVSSAQETTLQPAQRCPVRREEEFLLGAAVGLTVKPAERYDEETSKLTRQSTQSASDDDPNESGSSIIMDFINCFMKAKAQNWIDLSWFKRLLPTFFSEENRRSSSKPRFCAIACTEMGHGKCEGWLWHKRESRGISFFSWKKYWFILKHSTLYWFSHLNDTKADGFIYLPEFRIDLAPHCRRDHAFQATHARIKDFYFAGTCLDEMNYWICQMLQLALGSSFGDAAANAEYRHVSAKLYTKCVTALKRNFPVVWCNFCQEATTIVSVNPNFQYRRAQNISDEFIYFRPINAEIQERARKQKEENTTLAAQQPTREEYSRPGTPRNLWMESPENAESPGSDDMEVARSMYPFRERSIFRRSWAELLEAPLNSEGLHILQTSPREENRNMGYNKLTSEEENQVTIHPEDQRFQALQGPFPLLPERPKLQRQRSRSLPRYSEARGQYLNAPEFKLNAEETHFFPHDRGLLTEENIKRRYNMEGAQQRAIPSHFGEYPSIRPRFENSAIRRNIGIPEDNYACPRGNVRIPMNNVNTIPMVNVGVPMDNPQALRGNAGVPRGSEFRVYMGNSGRTPGHMVSSPLTELSKIGEHQL
ncbi:connector enhancer of kinase suppressor of ras 2-like isoform X3 [Peromyscus maniculatus bairdii]|uniref:connector enhancer of kinase suppressor of ras 2-like isoform X3 n=1 Tax=Peromyscus maniculatus bairdii TaxID=230844 RepID=UPI003FD21F43